MHDAVQLAIAVALTIVMGLEREETAAVERARRVAGVRTFPIVGAIGFCLARLSPGDPVLPGLGLAALVGFLAVAYAVKVRSGQYGATTEMAVLVAFVVGALVAGEQTVLATSVTVVVTLLLQAKVPLERFAERLPAEEIATFARFLLLTAVVLPILPNREYTTFGLNPFRIWLVVAAVSTLSYLSYVASQLLRSRHNVLLTGLLGGAYSSTLTTVVLARQSRLGGDIRLYLGAIIAASAVMYVRVVVLLWVFNAQLGWLLGPRLLVVAAAAAAAAGLLWLLSGRQPPPGAVTESDQRPHNPLEITAALAFAVLFTAITVATKLVLQHMGDRGLYALAGVTGLVDVDAFILGLTQTAGVSVPLGVAAAGVVLAAAANNVVKGVYALAFGERATGRWSLLSLGGLGLLSLLALVQLG